MVVDPKPSELHLPLPQEMDHPNGSFTLHDGPPYANGSLHMGAVLSGFRLLKALGIGTLQNLNHKP